VVRRAFVTPLSRVEKRLAPLVEEVGGIRPLSDLVIGESGPERRIPERTVAVLLGPM
jgi:hypothetical protein